MAIVTAAVAAHVHNVWWLDPAGERCWGQTCLRLRSSCGLAGAHALAAAGPSGEPFTLDAEPPCCPGAIAISVVIVWRWSVMVFDQAGTAPLAGSQALLSLHLRPTAACSAGCRQNLQGADRTCTPGTSEQGCAWRLHSAPLLAKSTPSGGGVQHEYSNHGSAPRCARSWATAPLRSSSRASRQKPPATAARLSWTACAHTTRG